MPCNRRSAVCTTPLEARPDDAPRAPSPAELAAIEAEWPLIEAELAVLDAEIVALSVPVARRRWIGVGCAARNAGCWPCGCG